MFVDVVTLLRILLTAVSLVLAAMALSAWNRRQRAPEAPIFAFLTFSAAIYCFGYAGEVTQTNLTGAMFWRHVEYFGTPWIPALWLLGARRLNGLSGHAGLLFAVPVITFIGELSNSWHGLYDRSVELISHGPFWVVAADRGPLDWLHVAYLNVALLYGVWIYLFQSPAHRRDRVQIGLLLTAALAPLAGYLIYLFGWSPWGLDLAPLTLGVSVVFGYLTIFHFGWLDLIPAAHSLVFSSMRDAVIVIDRQHRLVDLNLAARELLPCFESAASGDDLVRVLCDVPDIANALLGTEDSEVVDLKVKGEIQHFDVRVFPLCRDQQRLGSAAILENVTGQVRLVHELRRKAETDMLTGAANRRSFLTGMKREVSRSARHGGAFAVILLDFDRFKEINDRMGHDAGDIALVSLVGRIRQCLREHDLLSRYGGDEFAVLLPQTDLDGALEVAERIRASVADTAIEIEDRTIRVSISLGISTYDRDEQTDWRQLLRRADQALYGAKSRGRNQVAVWKKAMAVYAR